MTWPAFVFLAVSLGSLTVQGVSLVRLRRRAVPGPAYRGLLRTSGCRVAASVAYTALGVAALLTPELTGPLALVIFTGVQVLWMTNSVLDVRLRGWLATGGAVPNQHRRQRQPAPALRSVVSAVAVVAALGSLLWLSLAQQGRIDDLAERPPPTSPPPQAGKPVAGWTFTTVTGSVYDCTRDAGSPDDAATYGCVRRTP